MLVYYGLGTSLAGPLGTVYGLDIFTLYKGTLVASETALGKLVNTLVSGTSTSLDHIEDAALIRRKASDLPGNGSGERNTLGDALWGKREKEKKRNNRRKRNMSDYNEMTQDYRGAAKPSKSMRWQGQSIDEGDMRTPLQKTTGRWVLSLFQRQA